ncbi:type III-B CRISPR-associated protein Cas10/Cmr2 [Rhodoferax sp.]|uniref:type III-B CRISPR-associated protein Cas10/Cmr2 n=1 Tax=Rhodoferax sp. TaxID=50421 RepID=UPI002762BC4D|nr:type III-B CRISPR-associated protein Cas10/Cmr2 [Rhodoferax sp.]
MTNYTKKLAAWLHDPAEKQLVLMRDSAGHEGGTSRVLRKELAISSKEFDRRADHLAAAADRPNWPRQADGKPYPKFEAVHFAKHAQLIHPLSGQRLDLPSLGLDVGVEEIKAGSQAHFQSLIQENDDRKTFLAFWRFGPEAGKHAHELGELWRMLPADSRVPDHSIWSHLDTVCAIHTALAGDEQGPDEPALLVMSFGPVQGFIGQARSTSDLWAGSHLLSSLVWEAMKPIVTDLGPDAVVFPALRGVPVVDEWLMGREVGGDAFKQLFADIDSELLTDNTDTNPLFAASLPNKFMAIVPSRQAASLAERAVAAIRHAAKNWATSAAEKVFEAASIPINDIAREQVNKQLAGFPEAQWAAAVWPVGKGDDYKDAKLARDRLTAALDAIHPDLKQQGVFDAKVWNIITKELQLKDLAFSFNPNAGVLYPAVYELAERSLAAAKSTRPFAPLLQEGHRCTLTGEAEWLTHDRNLLGLSRKDRSLQSVWGELARKENTWVKPGEHLGAIATLKRLWPTLFAARVNKLVGADVRRFVVSTHALALSTTLDKLLSEPLTLEQQAALSVLAGPCGEHDAVTLPKSLMRKLNKLPDAQRVTLKRLPSLIEAQQDPMDGGLNMTEQVQKQLKVLFGDAKPETYYALILMDGDRMGGWLAGNEDRFKLKYRETWHTQVRAEMEMCEKRDANLSAYLNTLRPVSPGRHGAISQALNDFSTRLARHVVEDCCKGKLLYAGGDDVLALVAVDDLFDCMQLLRLAYSGIAPHEDMGLGDHIGLLQKGGSGRQNRLLLSKGFGLLDGRLMTLMGEKATASMGAVVAHHSAPLSAVLRELRAAESTAKNTAHGNDNGQDINRDAFCLRVLKRGGGEVSVTSPWWPVAGQIPNTAQSALALMKKLADALAKTAFSRGAIYDAQLWFAGLTDNPSDITNTVWRAQITASLAYQFDRKSGDAATANQVVDFVCDVIKPKHPRTAVEDFLVASEFFAREARSFKDRAQAAKAAKKEASTMQDPVEAAGARS